MLEGKKATIMLIFLVLIGISAALTAFFIASHGTSQKISNFGQAQLQIIDTYQKGEKALTFVDLTSRIAMQQSAYDTTKMLTACGNYAGYPLWNSKTKDCYPEMIFVEEYYLAKVNTILTAYFTKYEDVEIPKYDNYDFTINSEDGKTEVIGTAREPVVISKGGIITPEPPEEEEPTPVPTPDSYPESYPGSISTYSSPNYYQTRDPVSVIVLHHTAGDFGPTKNWFLNPESDASVHYVVDVDGSVYLFVSEDKGAWHAGISNWNGRTDVNRFSMGIEIVNDGSGRVPYTDAQYEAVNNLVIHLRDKYKIKQENIVGHLDVAPGRKIDPAYFDWSRIPSNYHTMG